MRVCACVYVCAAAFVGCLEISEIRFKAVFMRFSALSPLVWYKLSPEREKCGERG